MSKYHQGKFIPKNPEKYLGNVNEIYYRSSWEKKYMIWADACPQVISWGSEEIQIPYYSIPDQKMRRYFPDFIMKLVNNKGEEKKYMVEIKPKAQTLPPKKPQRMSKRYLTEMATYSINTSKWEAADAWCKQRGIEFVILNEDHLKV